MNYNEVAAESAPVNARSRLFTTRWKINPFEWKYALCFVLSRSVVDFVALKITARAASFIRTKHRDVRSRVRPPFLRRAAASVGWRSLRHVHFPTDNFALSNTFFLRSKYHFIKHNSSIVVLLSSLTNVCFTSSFRYVSCKNLKLLKLVSL